MGILIEMVNEENSKNEKINEDFMSAFTSAIDQFVGLGLYDFYLTLFLCLLSSIGIESLWTNFKILKLKIKDIKKSDEGLQSYDEFSKFVKTNKEYLSAEKDMKVLRTLLNKQRSKKNISREEADILKNEIKNLNKTILSKKRNFKKEAQSTLSPLALDSLYTLVPSIKSL